MAWATNKRLYRVPRREPNLQRNTTEIPQDERGDAREEGRRKRYRVEGGNDKGVKGNEEREERHVKRIGF